MRRTFNYPLYPTKQQEALFEQWLINCQQLYNGALQERRDAWRKLGKSLTFYDQKKELKELRQIDEQFKSIPFAIERNVLGRLDGAFKGFFRRLKKGGKAGFPRFKPRDRYDSFTFSRGKIKDAHIHIPKLGPVKLKFYRSIPEGAVIKTTCIKRKSTGKWVVSFSFVLGQASLKPDVIKSPVGIDLGLKSFAALSSGDLIDNPRFLKNGQELLKKRQQRLSKKRRGSSSRRRAKKQVAKAHEHIKNQRLDHARKLAKQLVQQHDLIAHEDLDIEGLIEISDFNKSINDAGWKTFIQCLKNKAEEAGSWVIAVDPHGTSQQCSRCGQFGPHKDLTVREHICKKCGLRLDRDVNAARNIKRLGLSLVGQQLAAGAEAA